MCNPGNISLPWIYATESFSYNLYRFPKIGSAPNGTTTILTIRQLTTDIMKSKKITIIFRARKISQARFLPVSMIKQRREHDSSSSKPKSYHWAISNLSRHLRMTVTEISSNYGLKGETVCQIMRFFPRFCEITLTILKTFSQYVLKLCIQQLMKKNRGLVF